MRCGTGHHESGATSLVNSSASQVQPRGTDTKVGRNFIRRLQKGGKDVEAPVHFVLPHCDDRGLDVLDTGPLPGAFA